MFMTVRCNDYFPFFFRSFNEIANNKIQTANQNQKFVTNKNDFNGNI